LTCLEILGFFQSNTPKAGPFRRYHETVLLEWPFHQGGMNCLVAPAFHTLAYFF
jgi:hypothetical protein